LLGRSNEQPSNPATMNIELIRADITSLKIDAIVNPRPSGGEVGTATVSSGGNVLCKFVITTIVPSPGEPDEERKLAEAIHAALHRAEELAVGSVAFPAIAGKAARVVLRTALEFRAHARSLQRVVFCAFSEEIYGEFGRALQELEQS
jgi:O-acetyl-ADP-ribose deacetylase (regulator of RNase III)